MIKNDLEYGVTKTWAEKFERALAALYRDEEKKKLEPIKWQSHHDGVLSQLEVSSCVYALMPVLLKL